MDPISAALAQLKTANPLLHNSKPRAPIAGHLLGKVLVANRGEIAKRFFFALREEGIGSVAIVADPDRGQTWYEFADEVVYIGDAANYARIPCVLAACELALADGIYPGYGFLSENPEFPEAIAQRAADTGRSITFLGPDASVMRAVGHKQSARELAARAGVPLFSGSALLNELSQAEAAAGEIGFPLMLKLDAGGGGQGMRIVRSAAELPPAVESAQRIGQLAYENADFYLERLIEYPIHIEVQIFNGTAVGVRKCAVQRRNQKVIEESGDAFLENRTLLRLLAAAEAMADACGYAKGGGAGTVEFLFDASSGDFGFLEMNTRLQVEYPVTDQALGIDLVRWQILQFDGREDSIPYERALRLRFVEKQHAIQCRIYAEDPRRDFAPSPGRIVDLDLPTFNGIRCDFGFKAGDNILSQYDPMIGKLIAFGASREEALLRMERALGELYVRGVTTNVEQLLEIVRHPEFRSGDYTNRILMDFPQLSRPAHEPEDLRDAAVYAAAAELTGAVAAAQDRCFASEDLEELLQSQELLRLPTAFSVEPVEGQQSFRVQFIQWALRAYNVAIDGKVVGSVTIAPRGHSVSDLQIIFLGRAVPVRVDRRSDHLHLRATRRDGRIRYYRLRVRQLGTGRRQDPLGMVRAPFQGTFVRLAERNGALLRPGARVEKGDALIVISAMKMETTLSAPVGGVIRYLVDDGDLRRLIRGQNERGLVLGRSLAEGEALVVVEPEDGQVGQKTDTGTADFEESGRELADALLGHDTTGASRGLGLMQSVFLGFLVGRSVAERVSSELRRRERADWQTFESQYRGILEVYTYMKQMYSAALGKNQTWFGEMHRLLSEWDNDTYRPPYFFRTVMARLLHYYGVPDDSARKNNADMRLAFFYILRGYHGLARHADFMDLLLDALAVGARPTRQLLKDLHRFMQQELPDRDDARARRAQKMLRRFHEDAASENAPRAADVGLLALSGEDREFLEGVPEESWQDFERRARGHLERLLLASTADEALAQWRPRSEAARHYVDRLRERAVIFALNSPYDDVDVFFARTKEGRAGFYCLAYLPEGRLQAEFDSEGRIEDAASLRRTAARAARVLGVYTAGNEAFRNYVHIFGAAHDTEIDLASADERIFNGKNLRRIVTRTLKHFQHIRAHMVMMVLRGRRVGSVESEVIHINVYTERGQAAFDLIDENDQRHPFWNGESSVANQRLYDRSKWPVEKWARLAFDPASATEVRVPSIDSSDLKVGARIYWGLLSGLPAVFFMKDSRVRGGATGDREGRKYVCAVLLAYRLDVPLYVWNDGAGADIREGMVSLNRAAEGFFVNAICNWRLPYARIDKLLEAHPDKSLSELDLEVRENLMPGLLKSDRGPQAGAGYVTRARPVRFFMTAVGVGSATGLDVYGSSQAALQIMLDSSQSYRVLTGAAVVQAVTGEELTNYEIGGAGVMGRWTGTVDFVAVDKMELLRQVRRLQLFFSERPLPEPDAARVAFETPEFAVISERIVESLASGGEFVNCKADYQDAAALLGGFARVGGLPALIMGPRTQAGIRSQASVVKARELLRTADRLALPRVLVLGRRWYRGETGENDEAVRTRMDFLETLYSGTNPRVHIIRHSAGLRRVTLNAGADALVYVCNGSESPEELAFARRTSTFVCNSLAEAWELTGRLLQLLLMPRPAPADTNGRSEDRQLRLPVDSSQPFDMRADVLEPLLDEGTMVIFHQTGVGAGQEPNLITALARLGGRAVAVIADQPVQGGAPDAAGTEKFRMFMRLVDRHSLPLIMLSNAPGFVPGTKQERLRIQQIGGESLDVNVLSRVPVVSVVLRQNYGGRQIHAFGRNLRPGIAAIALADATMAVMGAEAAFNLFKGKEYKSLLEDGKTQEAEHLHANYIAEFKEKSRADQDALRSGALDWTVETLEQLPAEIQRAVDLALNRAQQIL